MAQITLSYDARNNIAKKALDFLLALKVFKVENTEKLMYDPEFVKMVKEAEKGKTRTIENVKEFWESL